MEVLLTSGLLGCVTILFILILRKQLSSRFNIPGPCGLPYIGSAFAFFSSDPRELVIKWKKEYGDICHFVLFGKDIVLVSGPECVKEMLVTKSTECAGRMETFRLKYCIKDTRDVAVHSYSPEWMYRKKTFMNSLKMYGERLDMLEQLTIESLQEACKEIEALKGECCDLYPLLHKTTTNIITSIMFGHHLGETMTNAIGNLDKDLMELITPLGNGAELDIFPWLRYFPNRSFDKLKAVTDNFFDILMQIVNDNKKNFDPENPKCVFDALYQAHLNDKNEKGEPLLTESDILGILHNMVIGGSSTTTASLYSLLAILADQPQLQEKLQNELGEKVGARAVTRSDRETLHLLEATLLELMRYASVAPIPIPHATIVDVTLGKYKIPAGTELWVNLWDLHHDEKSWTDPWTFNPDRFLDEDGKLLPTGHHARKNMMPFSAGRRVCPGETLAKNRMFFIVATLLQNFTFTPPENTEMPTDPRNYELSLAITPAPFKIRAFARDY